jgi:tetratricopeptide (TPR) repeat protein
MRVTSTSGPATHISIRDALETYRRAVETRALVQAQRMTWRLLAAGVIDVRVLTHLAEHLFGAGETAPASRLARIAATIDPSGARPYRLALAIAEAEARTAGHRLGGWAHASDPSDAMAPARAAALARLAGDGTAAMLHFRRAATASPYSGVAWVNLAAELRSAGDTEKAANAARRAVCLAPALSVALFAAAEAAAAAFNHAATAKRYDRVLKVDPAHTAAYQNRGHARRRQGRTEAAIRDYRRSLLLAPAQPGVYAALAQLTLPEGDIPRVRGLFRRAAAADPANPEAGFFGALTDLRVGRFAEGWDGYAWFGELGFPRLSRRQRLPRWPAEEPAPTGLLVWNDQVGVGEEVMYLSAIPELAARAGPLVISCSPKLRTLVRRSFPDITVTSPQAVAERDPNLGPRPAETPLITAIAALRRSFGAFPAHRGYLAADPERVAALRTRYQDPSGRPLIGISWSSPLGFQGPRKSVPLADWGPVFGALDARFVSLQYHADAGEIAAARDRHGVDILVDEELDSFGDLDAHAAQIAAMDRVISISSIAAHLAGALGRPVDLLYPSEIVLLWYWFHGRTDSPWYPSMTIHRPPTDGDRAALMAAVARYLTENRRAGAAPG